MYICFAEFVVEFKNLSYVANNKNHQIEVILQFKFPEEFSNDTRALFPVNVKVEEIDNTTTSM